MEFSTKFSTAVVELPLIVISDVNLYRRSKFKLATAGGGATAASFDQKYASF